MRLKKVCGQTVNTYSSTIKFVLEYFMSKEMCHKAVNRCFFFAFDSVANQHKTCMYSV